MSATIEFYFDVLSPYSYIAYRRLPGMTKRLKANLELKPVSLPRLLEMAENNSPVQIPARFNYIKQDVPALAQYYGIPLNWPAQFPSRTGRAMSVLCCVSGEQQMELTRLLFEAYWIEGKDLGDREVLVSLVGEELVQQAEAESVREQLQRTTEEVVERGAFGVPTCFVDDQMFFGNDRLFMLQVHLNR